MSDALTSAGQGAPANGDPAANTTCMCKPQPKKKVPIVFSPGVMGSRLHFPGCNQSWDPDDTSGWFGSGLGSAMAHWYLSDADKKRDEMRWTNKAELMGKQDGLSDDEVKRGYGTVAKGYYLAFLQHVHSKGMAGEYNQNYLNPVYAVGYDWRQSNKDSGKALIEAVTGSNGILAKEGADQVILVSHSMGGMVTRSAMQQGLVGKVLGAIHIVQPVDGAVTMYRRCFTGAVVPMDADAQFDTVIGNTAINFVTVASGMPGAWQLLPTNNYTDEGKAWIHYKDGSTSGDWTGDVYALYMGTQSPPGISPPGLTNKGVLPDVATNLKTARAFHQELGHYQHPSKMRTIAGTNCVTDCSVLFDPAKQPPPTKTTTKTWYGGTKTTETINWKYQGLQRQAPPKGDDTVPHASAIALKPSQDADGVHHGDAFKAETTAKIWTPIDGWIHEFLS